MREVTIAHGRDAATPLQRLTIAAARQVVLVVAQRDDRIDA